LDSLRRLIGASAQLGRRFMLAIIATITTSSREGAKPLSVAQWLYDLFCSLRPQALQHELSIESLGNLDTLSQRLEAEVAASKIPAPMVALVGAWSRKPAI
jgi:hypothetical protein